MICAFDMHKHCKTILLRLSFNNISVSSLMMTVKPKHVEANQKWKT